MTVTDRLVVFLSDRERLFALFCHVADGGTVRSYADKLGLPYFAVASLYESDQHPFKSMREFANKAINREDRELARQAVRTAYAGRDTVETKVNSETGEIEEEIVKRYGLNEAEKRMIDAGLSLVKLETIPEAPPPRVVTPVQVNVSLGSAFGRFHKKTRELAIAAPVEEAEIVTHDGNEDLIG